MPLAWLSAGFQSLLQLLYTWILFSADWQLRRLLYDGWLMWLYVWLSNDQIYIIYGASIEVDLMTTTTTYVSAGKKRRYSQDLCFNLCFNNLSFIAGSISQDSHKILNQKV